MVSVILRYLGTFRTPIARPASSAAALGALLLVLRVHPSMVSGRGTKRLCAAVMCCAALAAFGGASAVRRSAILSAILFAPATGWHRQDPACQFCDAVEISLHAEQLVSRGQGAAGSEKADEATRLITLIQQRFEVLDADRCAGRDLLLLLLLLLLLPLAATAAAAALILLLALLLHVPRAAAWRAVAATAAAAARAAVWRSAAAGAAAACCCFAPLNIG